MLFRKDNEPQCAYCSRSLPGDNETLTCSKKGTVEPDSHCRAFKYDPLKRVPVAPPVLNRSKFNDEDFSL